MNHFLGKERVIAAGHCNSIFSSYFLPQLKLLLSELLLAYYMRIILIFHFIKFSKHRLICVICMYIEAYGTSITEPSLQLMTLEKGLSGQGTTNPVSIPRTLFKKHLCFFLWNWCTISRIHILRKILNDYFFFYFIFTNQSTLLNFLLEAVTDEFPLFIFFFFSSR